MFTVVLTSCRPPAVAAQALERLKPQCSRCGVELVVVRSWTSGSEELQDRLSDCRVIRCAPGATLPVMRGAGLAAVGTEWVAMTEDNCVADPDWLASLMEAARLDGDVLGGMIGMPPERGMLEWGAYFSEYGFYAGPLSAAAANVAYRSTVRTTVATGASAGEWEDVIHRRLAANGHRFRRVQGARVSLNFTEGLGAFCRNRFEHGREYAITRGALIPLTRRWLLAAGTPILPLLLAWRLWRLAGRDTSWQFLKASPMTLVFLGAWSAGETIGYLAGAGTA